MHYLRPDLLVLGFSERTSPAALDELCDTVFAQGAVTDVIVVVMPKAPTAIHLDMIFTQVDRELCVVYPPFFVGPERLPVLHRRKGRPGRARAAQLLRRRLREVGLPLEPVFAGGERPDQPGAGAVELGVQLPGGAAGHDRELPPERRDPVRARRRRASGWCRRSNFLAFDDWTDAKHRTVITIEGSRAGAGRRRTPLHVAAAPAGGRCDRRCRPIRTARCSIGCSSTLRAGPRAAADAVPPRCSACRARRTRSASGWPSRCSAPTRGCGSSPTGAGGWCRRRRARRCWTSAPSRWWTSRPPGCAPAGSDRITEIAVVVVHGGRREVVFDIAGQPGPADSPGHLRHHQHHQRDGARRARASPSWPTRCWPRSSGASSSPTTRGSTGTSSARSCGARGTWRWTGPASAPCGSPAGW